MSAAAASHDRWSTRDEELYPQFADELLRFAATLVGPSQAHDVFTAAVLRVFAAPGWATVDAPRAYLYRAVLNEARQTARASARRRRRERVTAISQTAEDGDLRVEVRVEVLDALRRLSLRQRAIVFLTYWLDLPTAATASTLGCRPPRSSGSCASRGHV